MANNIAERIIGKYLSLAKPHPISHPATKRKEKIKNSVDA